MSLRQMRTTCALIDSASETPVLTFPPEMLPEWLPPPCEDVACQCSEIRNPSTFCAQMDAVSGKRLCGAATRRRLTRKPATWSEHDVEQFSLATEMSKV